MVIVKLWEHYRNVEGMSTHAPERTSANAWHGFFLLGCSLPFCLLFVLPQREEPLTQSLPANTGLLFGTSWGAAFAVLCIREECVFRGQQRGPETQ